MFFLGLRFGLLGQDKPVLNVAPPTDNTFTWGDGTEVTWGDGTDVKWSAP